MRVDLGFAAVERDVADQRKHFHLLVHRDTFVVLLFPVEIAEYDALEGADGGEAAGIEILLPRKTRESRRDLIA